MYPNYNYPNVPSGSGGPGYPYMQQPLLPGPPMAPMGPPMVPHGYNEEYTHWAQWNSHFGAMAPTQTWRHQASAAMRPTPYDRPVTIQHQVPYGGRPYVPRDLSGPNANTVGALPVPPSLNQSSHDTTFYNNIAPSLDFDVNVSSTKLDIFWRPPHVSGQIMYELTITEGRSMPFTLDFPANHTRHTMRAKAGESYVIAITARKTVNGVTVANGTRNIKAIFSSLELRQLYDKAVKYTGTRMHPFELLYRCKPKPYWDDIHHNCGNIMEKYMKDDNGQPANMINGVISGLFFSARLLPNGTLPCSSPFGNVRMLMQAVMLLDPTSVNIYFADFYCNKAAHYVTVIVARKGSESDLYSQKYLIQLDMKNNPWLKYMMRPAGDGILFYAAYSVWVEVLYTESVPLSWGRFDKIAATGIGTSKIGGLSNNKQCTICNLYPPGAAAKDADAANVRDATRGEAETSSTRGEEIERRKREEANRRSISPGLVDEDEHNEESPEFDALNEEDDDLDGVPLPAYEMGGNSTFQTVINLRNVNDYPNWTDLLECACEVVDGVVMMEQRERERQITSCDARVEKAIEEMDSIVGTCDDDRIHDLAGEVHEQFEWWQRARDELTRLLEARDAREEKARIARAALATPPAQAPPPTAAAAKRKQHNKNSCEEEDLDEYLEDDDAPAAAAAAPTPAAAAKPRPLPFAPTPPPVRQIPLPPVPTVVVPTARPKPTVVPPLNWLGVVAPVATVPQQPVQPLQPTSSRRKKERKEKVKVKEEELDEYLDDDESAPGPATKTTVEVKQETTVSIKDTIVIKQEATVSIKDTVVIKQKEVTVSTKTTVPIKQEEVTVVDLLEDSALDLSLFDEVGGNASMLVVPTATTKDTVASRSIEGEDEWLEEEDEDTVDLKRSIEASRLGAVPQKRAKTERTGIETIDLTEDELLLGSGSCSDIEITPEMEEELLRLDS